MHFGCLISKLEMQSFSESKSKTVGEKRDPNLFWPSLKNQSSDVKKKKKTLFVLFFFYWN